MLQEHFTGLPPRSLINAFDEIGVEPFLPRSELIRAARSLTYNIGVLVMASRPPRTPKSDSSSQRTPPPSRTEKPGGDLEAGATIKDSSLERREIPSYSDSREARIAERAYWRAEQRGFAPGGELEDWLEAEREVDRRSTSNQSAESSGRSEDERNR